MKQRNYKLGYGSIKFWKVRNKLAAESDKSKNEVTEDLANYCEENFDNVLANIKRIEKPKFKENKPNNKFYMRF